MSDFTTAIVPVTPFAQNCSLLRCRVTGRGAVIDPGGDVERLLEAAAEQDIEIEKIFLTHGHIDHAGGAGELAERLKIPIEGPHVGDKYWIDDLPEQGHMFGVAAARSFEPDRWLEQGDTVGFGDVEMEVHFCPGHTPGHVVFFHAGAGLAFVGDVLFQGSIGRTDFPGGDHATLIASIRRRLWPLGDETTFVPGHGPTSTFGAERKSNPFVGDGIN